MGELSACFGGGVFFLVPKFQILQRGKTFYLGGCFSFLPPTPSLPFLWHGQKKQGVVGRETATDSRGLCCVCGLRRDLWMERSDL